MSRASETGAQGDVSVVPATLRRDSCCGICRAALPAGRRARVGVNDDAVARFFLCDACTPTAAMTAPLPVALASSELTRGSLAVWVAVGALGVRNPLPVAR